MGVGVFSGIKFWLINFKYLHSSSAVPSMVMKSMCCLSRLIIPLSSLCGQQADNGGLQYMEQTRVFLPLSLMPT